MTKTSKRTHPTDRDGDGNPGGSLPGNQTAPFATAEDKPADNPADTATAETSQPAETPPASSTPAGDNQSDTVDDLADTRTTPGDSPEKLEAIEREVDEANAAARDAEAEFQADAATEAREDSGTIEGADEDANDDDPHEACSRCQDEHPEAMLQDGLCANCVDEEEDEDEALAASVTGSPILDAIAEAEPDLVAQTLEDHADDFTFDAEQVEAGTGDAVNFAATEEEHDLIDQIVVRGTVMDIDGKQPHDERSSRMDITATHANGNPLRLQDLLEADDFNFAHDWYGIRNCIDRTTGKLMNLFRPRFSQPDNPEQAETRPQAAARIRELRELVQSKFLYKSAEGYSATYKAPFISEETVKVWIEAGLAEDVPSAGHMGGIRSTPAARREMVHIAGAYRDDAAA